jgi:hypothetical protein
MNTQDDNRDVFHSQYFDPFPQPQTIPAGWDLSGLFPAPQSGSDQQTEDSSETESN